MTTLHLISGLPCSGKTTYAAALKADTGAITFCLDYWLITLFGKYSIDSVGHDEHVRRVLACRELIWELAQEFLRRETDVILDDGFFLKENRVKYAKLAEGIGAKAKVHFLDTSEEILRARITQRNSALPLFNFSITPVMLKAFICIFEAPSPNDVIDLVRIESTGEDECKFSELQSE